MKNIKLSVFIVFIFIFSNTILFAQERGVFRGHVVDPNGAAIVGAFVSVVDINEERNFAASNKQGEYVFSALPPGKYRVEVTVFNYSYDSSMIEVLAGKTVELKIVMRITPGPAPSIVEVTGLDKLSTDPSNNFSQTVLTEKNIKDLPDDPDQLEAYLQALAGGTAGSDGAEITIDGFRGRVPPKEAIREIRFNQNPFSAEYDRIGFGRIEIITKPGFEKFHGGASFNFNDSVLNARNPFAANRANSQLRNFGGNFNGPIKAKKSSFFVDFGYLQNDSSTIITATVLDPSNNIVGFNRDVTIPSRRFYVSSRIDYALNEKNTLQGRYTFNRNTAENEGIGGFSLPSRAFASNSYSNDLQLSESMLVNTKTVNETRFQFQTSRQEQHGDNSIPTILVANAFTGGGSQVGNSYNKVNRWDLQNYTTTALGKNLEHSIKFGVRIRHGNIDDFSQAGYGGIFTFAGIAGQFSSIEQYRQKVLGNPNPIFNPTQFSITTGNPLASVNYTDYGLFLMDDWKVRRDLTLSFGLRYENQNNISDHLNFAPRLGVAWQPGAGGKSQPKTVFRGGVGIFYERFEPNNTLITRRRDGVSQRNYVVTDNPAILGQAVFTNNGVTNVPTVAQLALLAPLTSIPYRTADNLQAPYSIQSVVSVERQLPFRSGLSATFLVAKSLHLIRMRNINAPVCPDNFACPTTAAALQILRPNPSQGNIYQFESSGNSLTKQLIMNFNNRFSNRVSFFGNYTLSYSNGDVDRVGRGGGGASFPAYSYDLSGEFGETAFNARHTFFVGGSASLPWGVRMNPTIYGNSSRRFNLRTGVDSNQDSIFNERPTYAALAARCQQLGLTNSFCNLNSVANPNATIPRTYGYSPASFGFDLNFNKTIGFGGKKNAAQNGQNNKKSDVGGGMIAVDDNGQMATVMAVGGKVPIGDGGGGDAAKPYNLSFGLNIRNVLNHVNLSSPQSSMTSPFFGKSISIGDTPRRIDLSMRFSW